VYSTLLADMRRNVDSVGAPKSCYPDAPVSVFVKGVCDGDGDMVIVMEDLGRLGYRHSDRFEFFCFQLSYDRGA
jgi:hypothetical protein